MSSILNLRFDYNWDAARRDLVAGATVAAIAIPQAMAYALIAGVDPRFGLYSAIVVTVLASLFGSSSHLINGPTNAISLLVFGALVAFDERFETYQAMFLLAILVGIIQILIAVFKLGDLTRYVSESVIFGFMAGAGVLVAVGQVGNFLGIAKKGSGDQSVLMQLWETLTKGGDYNPYAIGLGVGTILLVLLLRRIINRYKLPQMDMLLGLIAATADSGTLPVVNTCSGRQNHCFGGRQSAGCASLIPYSRNQFRMAVQTDQRRCRDFLTGLAGSAGRGEIHRLLYPPTARL